MRALKFPLVLALSMAVASAIGFAGCTSDSTPKGGTGGAGGGVAGSNGSGGSGSGGASSGGMGGSTGSGGRVDAGSDTRTAAGGAAGQDSGANPNCTALLACCNMAPAGPLKTNCMAQYNTAMAQGDGACAGVLQIIRGYGVCN